MKNLNRIIVLLVFCSMVSPLLSAPVVYPAQGQSAEQQKKDQGECHVWAVDNTGVDPAVLAANTSQQQAQVAQQAAQPAAQQQQQVQQQAAQQQQALASSQQEQLDTYYRAYGACLSGRGYSVN